MIVREVLEKEKSAYNKLVTHVIQSWEWGEFRKKMGTDVVRLGHFNGSKMVTAYQLTFHPVPHMNKTVGYFPKGPLPDKAMIRALLDLGAQKNAAFIKIEPNVLSVDAGKFNASSLGLVESKKALFTKYNFLLDMTKAEEQLLAAMHPKTRYNIGV